MEVNTRAAHCALLGQLRYSALFRGRRCARLSKQAIQGQGSLALSQHCILCAGCEAELFLCWTRNPFTARNTHSLSTWSQRELRLKERPSMLNVSYAHTCNWLTCDESQLLLTCTS